MSYTDTTPNSTTVFPSHEIDPRDKGFDWILQYTKAAFNDAKGFLGNMLYFGASRYKEIRRYGMGKQTINKYKRIYGIDEQNNSTFMTTDWSPVAIAAKYREIAISMIAQKMYDFEIFAVDPQSKVEQDDYFTQLQLRMQMRQMVQQMNLPIQNFPQFQKQQGEPEDDEEFAIKQSYGYKHNLAMEAELGCSYVHQYNDVEEARLRTAANLFDFGIGGYRDWIDATGMTRYREVNPENFIASYCSKNDFSDMVHGGEVIEVMLVDLVPYFDQEQIKIIAKTACGQYGNPTSFSIEKRANNYWGNFKVYVWDLVFYSWNTTVYRNEVDKLGNLNVSKTDYQNKRQSMSTRSIQFQGAQYPEFVQANRKVVYKTKWIIGTEYMYDWGLMENTKRNAETWWDTQLPYRMYAWNFDKMQFTGITERLIPIIDDWHRTYYKLQDIKNKLMPYIMNLNLSAVEMAGMAGKGGEKLKPEELIDFLMQDFIAPFRETDLLRHSQTGKVAWFESTGQLEVMLQYRNELIAAEQQFMSVTGLNDVTNGSTIDEKTLVPNIQAQIQSTNNCLYLISRAEKNLYYRLTNAIIEDLQLAVQIGTVEGYIRAVGKDFIQYFQLSEGISFRKFGLFVKDAPTPQERMQFLQDLKMKDANGLIEPQDYIIIKDTPNLKQAAEILADKLKKRKEQAQQYELQKIQQANQGQAQMALALEQEKQKTLALQLQGDIQLESVKGQWQFIIERMKKGADNTEAQIQAEAKKYSAEIQAHAKVMSTHLTEGMNLLTTHMDNETAKETAKRKSPTK